MAEAAVSSVSIRPDGAASEQAVGVSDERLAAAVAAARRLENSCHHSKYCERYWFSIWPPLWAHLR